MSYGTNDPFKELPPPQYGGQQQAPPPMPDFFAPPPPPPQYMPTDDASNAAAGGVPGGRDTVPPPSADAAPAAAATSRFWRRDFYRQFFDVNTQQVLLRLSNVLVPLNPPDFLMDRDWFVRPSDVAVTGVAAEAEAPPPLEEAGVVLSRSPDLYGPFWVCTTLWMVIGVVSNLMSRIAYSRQETHTAKWAYSFSVASVACVVMYLYCFVFGAVVWGLMKWKGLPATLLDTVCLYGYSMFMFILVAVLCMVPVGWLQWIFVLVGGLWSTAYLLANFWHMWRTSLDRVWFLGIVALVAGFHLLLTFSFKFYFFKYKL